ncbi:hypothetical protein NUV66_17530 [Pseudomonas sp. 32.2.56]|uniref:hypothetical protein n=1 Tax=Pseudomonas sp. 32.2.56 TaxID=2969303 RepID=UPI00214FA3D1|nr:hypothetical protein [Pseudomonas sp. 32.2.56]MCR4511109.1 hypothetical protein [Pseudomonas sp. 32.2.56]
MNKENEGAADDTDFIDRTILRIETLALKYGKQLCAIAPPAVGFSIFLAYFIKQGFYPSFDILQFTSLLISAFLTGGILIIALTLIMSIPGFAFRGFFRQDKDPMIEIKASFNSTPEDDHSKRALSIYRTLIAIPILAGAVTNYLGLLLFTEEFSKNFFLAPILIPLISCALANYFYDLKSQSVISYFFVLAISITMSNLAIISTIDISSDLINQIKAEELQYIVILIAYIAVATLITISCIGAFAGYKYVIYANLAFSSAIMFYSGALSNFPDEFIKKLGLGNYTATSIILEKDFCEPAIFKIEINNNCELRDAFVIWSLGEYTVFRVKSEAGGTYKFQVQNKFIKAIVIKNSKSDDITKK